MHHLTQPCSGAALHERRHEDPDWNFAELGAQRNLGELAVSAD
jgi:hypothetical protein